MNYQLNPLLLDESFGIVTPGQYRKIDKLAKQKAKDDGQSYSSLLYRNKKEREYFKKARKEVLGK